MKIVNVFIYYKGMDKVQRVIDIAINLRDKLNASHFDFDGFVYNPFDYAFENYMSYVVLAVKDGQKALFMGMNPGPFGMVQTGVPFGEINAVKDYLGINNPVGKPKRESPLRPVDGMNCKRSEVSGARFWDMAKKFGTRDEFFSSVTVINYCPLAFISNSGTNITPVELSKNDRLIVERICDESLSKTLDVLDVPVRIAIGRYAEEKLSEFGKTELFLHPSPRNPKSRLFWPDGALNALKELINDQW